MKWARRQQIASGSLKAMLNAIAARADDKGNTWVAQATLAADMSVSDRHVRTLLDRLEALGIISRRIRSAGRSGRLTDEISLALYRDFSLTTAEIRSGCKISNRNKSTLPTGTRVPGNRKGTTPPYQDEGSTKLEGCSATSEDGSLPSGGETSTSNVIPLRLMRGVA